MTSTLCATAIAEQTCGILSNSAISSVPLVFFGARMLSRLFIIAASLCHYAIVKHYCRRDMPDRSPQAVGARPERSEPDQADHCKEVLRADAPRGDGQRTVRQWATSVIALARIFWLSTKTRASRNTTF